MPRFTPPEIQDLILEAAGNSQYPTLQLVCKSWNKTISRIFKKQYRQVPRTNDADVKKYFGKSYTAPSEDLTPFLIHGAICEFTGRVKIKEDWSADLIFQIDTNFGPEDGPEVVAETLRLKECANEQVFIRDTSQPHDLRYPIYIGWLLSDPQSVALTAQGGSSGNSFIASRARNIQSHQNRDYLKLKPESTMKVAEFVSLYFQYTRHDERYPPKREKGGKFVTHTGMWAPFYGGATTEAMEAVKRINIKIVYMEQ